MGKPEEKTMAVRVRKDLQTQTAFLVVTGKLTFGSYKEFTSAYSSLQGESLREYVLDLRQLDYLDSAALGMLLRFKEMVGAERREITILTSHNMVEEILRVSRFDALFRLQTGH